MSSTTVARTTARSETAAARAPYDLFEVTGLELEYAVVGADLQPLCIVEDAFRALAGRPVSDLEADDVGFSNELAAHVFEIKTLDPETDLALAEARLVHGLRRFADVLRQRFDARLLPTGMHPLMKPGDTQLWRRSGRAIYETYARLFSIEEHGWLNVQSCQTNLPFGPRERDAVLLHNAVACLLPYLPALATSSPIVEGRPGTHLCNRMAFYKTNQHRVPEIAGDVVPEYMTSFAQYRRDVFEPIYRALDQLPGSERIRNEFVNSRGAIPRFVRDALEVRVVDLQECVKMDVAVAAFVRLAAKGLWRLLDAGRLRLPEHAMLVEDYEACVALGRAARVEASHLCAAVGYRPGAATATTALHELLDLAWGESTGADQPYLRLAEERIRTGNLAEVVLRATGLDRRSEREGRTAIERVYGELADCLLRNQPWQA